MQHTALGQRWVYDGVHDPVFRAVLATTILTGGRQADLEVDQGDGTTVRREPTTRVAGSGSPGTAVPDDCEVEVRRDLAAPFEAAGATLTGTWPGQDEPVVLAAVR